MSKLTYTMILASLVQINEISVKLDYYLFSG